MAHLREGVRNAVVTAVTGLTTTGANVFHWRLYAQEEDALPSLTVMVAGNAETVSESIENEFGDLEVRDLPVKIEIRAVREPVKAQSTLLDKIDDICAEVEIAVMGNSALAALVVDVKLDSTEIEMTGEGEYPIAVATMEWMVRYSVDTKSPTA